MSHNRKHITRSKQGSLGGVCAGIAGAYECEPLVIRILFVALTPLTAGIAGVVYLVLWKTLPMEETQDAPLDIQAQEVVSATYGQVKYVSRKARLSRRARQNCRVVSQAQTSNFARVGHLPPVPPRTWQNDERAQHGTAQQSTAQHSTAQHSTEQRTSTQHLTTQQSTAQHTTQRPTTQAPSEASYAPHNESR